MRRRTAVSPKMARMSSRPMPRTSSRFCSSSGAAALDGGLVDAVQVHRVVGHQAVAARDQLQPQLAFAQARFAGDQHAQAQDVHEHAVHGGAVGEMFGQVGAQHVDDEGRRLVRGEQRDLRALAHRHQRVGAAWPSASTSTGGSSVTMRAMRRSQSSAWRTEVGDLALAQDLRAIGDGCSSGSPPDRRWSALAHHRPRSKAPLRGPRAGHPLPAQQDAWSSKSASAPDDVGFHAGGWRAGGAPAALGGCQPAIMACSWRRRRRP